MLALLLAVLIAASPTPTLKPYSPEGAPFEVGLPAGWEVDNGLVMTAASPFEGPTDRFRENLKVAVAPLAAGLTLEAYVKNSVAAYEKLWVVHDRKATTLAGVPAVYLLLDQKVGPSTTRLVKYFLVHEGQVLVVTGAAEPGAFDRYLPTFLAMVHSLKLKTPVAVAPGSAVRGKGFSVVPLPGWKVVGTQGGGMLAVRREGGDGVSLLAVVDRGTLADSLSGLKRLYEDGELGTITQDLAVQLGGRPGRKVVAVYEDEAGGDTLVRYMVERGGQVAELRFKVDLAKPPAALLAEFEAIATSFKWE